MAEMEMTLKSARIIISVNVAKILATWKEDLEAHDVRGRYQIFCVEVAEAGFVVQQCEC